ncbi:MAG: NRDE family protein [Deltaproteobacteria bacterium]|nr:NRDE family protein [Deltaproteobacteria bacterium]
MCTLVLGLRAWEDADLLVAANRDERLDRRALPPRRFDDRGLPVLAPQDIERGGTWLGLNARGLFAGVTNRFGAPRDPRRRSRGELVFDALEAADCAQAAERLAGLQPGQYNPFHLLVADRRAGLMLVDDGRSLHRKELGPGLHVLTERSFSDAAPERETWLQARLASCARCPDAERFRELLSFHHPIDPFDGTCVHVPWLGYGTRSATLIRLGAGGDLFLHAEGPPCETPWADYGQAWRDTAGNSSR